MLCEKTHTQLPLAGLVDLSGAVQNPPESNAPPVETESLEADRKPLTQAQRQKRWREKHPEAAKRQKRRHHWRHRERLNRNRKARSYRQHGPPKKIHGRTIAEKKQLAAEYAANRHRMLLSNPDTAEEYRAKKKVVLQKWMAGLKADPIRFAEFKRRDGIRRRTRMKSPEARAKSVAATRAWQDANWERLMQYQTDRYRNNPQVNLAVRARNGVRRALRYGGLKRTCRTAELLGCSWSDFVVHIERQFLPGMNWSNMDLWQIDHVKSLSKWDLTDPVQLAAACNFRNLAPLWAEDNARKGNRDPQLPSCSPAFEVAKSAHETLP